MPDDVRALIGRALRKDPARRFPDGTAFLRAIEDVRAGRPPAPAVAGTGTEPLWLLPVPGEPVPLQRTGRLSRLLVPVAALAAGVGIALAGLQLGAAPAAPPAAAADAAQSTVLLVAAEHEGRPVGEVEADLAALGLRVELRPEAGDGVPAGQVTGVSPSGALRPGDLVVVRFAEPPPDPAPSAPAPAPAAATAPAPVSAPVSTPVSTPAPTPAPAAEPPLAPAPAEQVAAPAPPPAPPPPAPEPAVTGTGTGGGDGRGGGNGRGNGGGGGNGNGGGDGGPTAGNGQGNGSDGGGARGGGRGKG